MTGMFGAQPNWGEAIAAALNGYLAAGGNQIGAANLQQMHARRMDQQKQMQDALDYERKRADHRDEFLWEQQHQAPGMTERFAAEILNPNTPEDRRELLRSIVAQPPAPMTMTTPQGTYIGGRSEMPNAAGGPQPGSVQDGYRFKGGNPADPNAWEQLGGQTSPLSGPFPNVGPYIRR